MQAENTKEFLERLVTAIEEQDAAFVSECFNDVHPADISQILDGLNTPQSKYVIDQLPREVVAEILADLDSDTRSSFLKVFESTELATIVSLMESDDAVDLLDELPIKNREEVIALIDDPITADHIIELLHYDEDCAGGLMAKELIKANVNWTVTETINEIRRQAENVEKIYSVYVVDDNDRLLGKVSVKKLLLARSNTRVVNIFEDDIVSIESYRPVDDVVEVMRKYDLEALPVVNIQGKLIGRITIDDIVDVITEDAEESQQIMSGMTGTVEVDDDVFASVKARVPWLLIGMAGGLLGSQFINLFEGDLKLIPAMASFIPLITATGGNVGIQSSTVIIQSLANKTLFNSNVSSKMIRLTFIALVNALILSGIVMIFFVLFAKPISLGLVVGSALFSVVMLATIMGTATPIILEKIGVNPALASGPFITTANDLLGLAVYFTVAHFLLTY